MTAFEIPPGQPSLRRRARTHPMSLAAQRGILGGPGQPTAIRGLASQSTAEPAIALLDAFAVVADIVSFYSERHATEGYLRTATERRSVRELARTLGHELRPGVSAGTVLVVTLEDAAGAPGTAAVAAGTPVQSVPGPGQTPQVFETAGDLTAHAGWNAIRAEATTRQLLRYNATDVWLRGRHPELRVGEAILVVGDERLKYRPGRDARAEVEKFDLRHVEETEEDPPGHPGWTRMVLDRPLGFLPFRPLVGTMNQRLWHLTERGQLFGATAPDPGLMWQGGSKPVPVGSEKAAGTVRWTGYALPDATAPEVIEVDGDRRSITPGSWIVLEQDDNVEAYVVRNVEASGANRWGVSGKLTRIGLDLGDHLDRFSRPAALVHHGGVELPSARRRPAGVLEAGAVLALGPFEPLLPEGHPVVLRGVDEGGAARVETATVLQCVATAEDPLEETDEEPHRGVELTLTAPVAHRYRADTLVVHGNVVAATHGQTVTQVLGSGDGHTPFRSFPLRQGPLTHLRAVTASGAAPALEVRVDGVRWHEVEGFADAGPHDRVYTLVRHEGAVEGQPHQPTSIVFGDGVHGAIPPTGAENIEAVHRAGIGAEGDLEAGQLTLLVRRPLGVRGVANPAATVDWAPPEALEEARANAPQRVRTLGRAVSIADYADVARGYAGVGQVAADQVWDGRTSTVVVSVRGVRGAHPTGRLLADLAATLDLIRDPRLPVRVLRGALAGFGITVEVRIDPDHVAEGVHAAIREALDRGFGAGVRDLGRPVTAASVLLVVRRVPGVQYCTMPRLHRLGADTGPGPGDGDGAALLVARGARWEDAAPAPAELLALGPADVEIGELP